MGVAIGIPVCGLPSWSLVRSLMSLEWPAGPRGFLTAGEYDRPLPIDVAHNRIIEAFLTDKRLEWLLMMDADATLHPQTLLRLLSWKQPVVGALCFTRRCPASPTIYAGQPPGTPDGYYRIHIAETKAWLTQHPELIVNQATVLEPRPDDALARVDFTGAHCLLVHRRVLDAIKPPWFARLMPEGRTDTGSDRYFCEQARAAGYPIYVDRSVLAGHGAGDRTIGALDFLAWDSVTDWANKRFIVGPSAKPPAAKPAPGGPTAKFHFTKRSLTIGED